MGVTFNIELDSKANKKGEKLVMIRCTLNGAHKRINTGIHLLPKFWDNKKKQIKKNHISFVDLNKSLSQQLEKLQTNYNGLLIDKDIISLEQIIAKTQDVTIKNFYDFAHSYKLNEFKIKKKLGTFRRYEAVLNKLKDFAGKTLSINQVNYTLLKDFERYLFEVKQNSRDTVSSNLSVIRSVLSEAIKHGFYETRNPFDSLTLVYTDNTKEKLTIEEIRAFDNVSLPKIPSLHLAKDFFMACFYAGGCRAGDMILMRWDNLSDNTFSYTQQKTGTTLVLPILPKLQDIFNRYEKQSKYIFPLLKENEITTESIINSRISYINKYLKEVCKYVENPRKLTPSRHEKLTPFGHFKLTP